MSNRLDSLHLKGQYPMVGSVNINLKGLFSKKKKKKMVLSPEKSPYIYIYMSIETIFKILMS